jgi:hypothetical protein
MRRYDIIVPIYKNVDLVEACVRIYCSAVW